MASELTGRCNCGAIRYRVTGAPLPLTTTVCNCTDCQRSSGSSFSVVMAVRASTFHHDGEQPASYRTTGTDSHENRARDFCAKCGSPISSVLAEAPEIVWIKTGTLDDTSKLNPAVEVWTGSAQAWTHRVPKRPHIKRGPPKLSLTSLRPALKLAEKVLPGKR